MFHTARRGQRGMEHLADRRATLEAELASLRQARHDSLLGATAGNAEDSASGSRAAGSGMAATLLLLNALTGRLSSYSPRLDKLLEGEPVILASNGVLFGQRLKAAAISENEFHSARREAGIATLAQVRLAVLETSGRISFLDARE